MSHYSPQRWVMLGYGPFGRRVLEVSLDQGWAPVAVMTHLGPSDLDDVTVESVARSAQLSVSTANPNKEGLSWLRSLDPDVLFTVNYRLILTTEVLAIPRKGGFNVHGSLLPRLRGRSPITWAIILGHDETGVTVHTLRPEVDTGDVVVQSRIPIELADTSASIQSQMLELYPRLVEGTLRDVATGTLTTQPQVGEPTYGKVRHPEDGEISWHWSARQVYNWVRALTRPYPGAFTYQDGVPMRIWKAAAVELPDATGRQLGEVIGTCIFPSGKVGWAVTCGDGIVCIEEYETDAELKAGARLGVGPST